MNKFTLEQRTLEELAQDPILVDLLREKNLRVQELFTKYGNKLIDGEDVGNYVSFLQELQKRDEIVFVNDLHIYNNWAKRNLQKMITRSYDLH